MRATRPAKPRRELMLAMPVGGLAQAMVTGRSKTSRFFALSGLVLALFACVAVATLGNAL
jgi:hypothetical protein